MKKLHDMTLARLKVIEFGQFMKTSMTSNDTIGVITDASTLAYMAAINAQNATYDLAMKNIAKSDESIKIKEADTNRDNSITVFERQLSVFEFSLSDTELDAYVSLSNLMNVYKNMQRMNYEEETNTIDNFLAELNKPIYQGHILTLSMDSLVLRINIDNAAFKTLFLGRMEETSNQEVYDVKVMRKTLQELYQDFAGYILSMAKLQPTSQFNSILNLLNGVRKYYHDLVAIRAGKKGDETPIPPMS